jgi:hypothetical protein
MAAAGSLVGGARSADSLRWAFYWPREKLILKLLLWARFSQLSPRFAALCRQRSSSSGIWGEHDSSAPLAEPSLWIDTSTEQPSGSSFGVCLEWQAPK